MPPSPKRNYSVVLFDLAARNQTQAQQALLKIYATKSLSQSKDLVKLILVNTEDTYNTLNQDLGGFEHITEVGDVTLYNPKLFFNQIKNVPTTFKANWLDALLVATQCLAKVDIKNIVTNQILFVTDLSGPFLENKKNVQKVIAGLKELNAFLYVFLPTVKFATTITCESDIRLTMKKEILFGAESPNLLAIQEIVKKINNGVICDIKMGLHLFFTYQNPIGKQPWNVPLTIGTSISIPASTMKFIEQKKSVKLKESQAQSVRVWVHASDQTKEVDWKDAFKGIACHGKFVAAQPAIAFKSDTEKSFNILGFTHKKHVPEVILLNNNYCVVPLPNTDVTAFFALLQCLTEKHMYAIAKRVYSKGYEGKYMVLIPNLDEKYFLAVELPCGDEVFFGCQEGTAIKNELKTEKNEDVVKFLESVTINGSQTQLELPLTPNMMFNPSENSLINQCLQKMFPDESFDFKAIDMDLEPSFVETGFINNLKEKWPVREVVEEPEQHANQEEDDNDDENYEDGGNFLDF